MPITTRLIHQSVWRRITLPIPTRWLPFSLLLGFVAIFWRYHELVNLQWDFGAYYVAGRTLITGANPYDPQALIEMGKRLTDAEYHGLLFLYPPLFLRLLTPLLSFDLYTAAFIWFGLKCAALEVMLVVTLYLMRFQVSVLSLSLINIAALTFHPFGLDISSGNVAIFEGTLILSGLLAWSKQRNVLAAGFITLGSFMKISPFLLVLYPLHNRDKQFLYSLLGCLILFFVIAGADWPMTSNYVQFTQSDAVTYHWDEQVQSVYNISMTSFILRTFAVTYFYEPLINAPWLVPIVTPLSSALVFVVLVFAIQQNEKTNSDPHSPTLYCALLLAVLLIPPRLAGYTLSWSLFPCVYLVVHSFRQKRWPAFILSLGGVFLIQWYFPPSQIQPGFEQILIDSEMIGLFLLFISSVLLIGKEDKTKTT